MGYVWSQFVDFNLQLCLSVVIGTIALECLVALWAAMSRAHWFWRALAVWASVAVFAPLGAGEPIWVLSLTAALIVAIVQTGRLFARRMQRGAQSSDERGAPRYRYSLQDLLLVMLIIGLWLPVLSTAARYSHAVHWQNALAGPACLAGLAVIAAKAAIGPRRWRAILALAVALPLAAWAMFSQRSQAWMITGNSGTYLQEMACLIIAELQFVLVIVAAVGLARYASSPAQPRARRVVAAATLLTVAGVWGAWLAYVYVQLLERPPVVARFELAGNQYPRILELATLHFAINARNASVNSLRAASPPSPQADQLENIYGELFTLLAGENAVDYDPERDCTLEYMQQTVGRVQMLRSLNRSFDAEAEAARAANKPDVAADFALASLRLSQMLIRGGTAIDALVGRAMEGVAHAQLAKTRHDLSEAKRHEVMRALAHYQTCPDDIASLRARERDYGERILGFSARMEHTFLKLVGRRPPWEESLTEAARRKDAQSILLQTDLAIRGFQHTHGRPPRTLADLVPAYLPTLPLDPYTGLPLCENPTDHGLTIYSAGRDGIDNGGRFATTKEYWNTASGYDLDLDMLTRP